MTVNNVEVAVNTCTCTDVFTIITTKDQSGGIYNNYSTGGQGFMAVVNKPPPQATPLDSVCLVIVIAQVPGIYGSKQTESEGVAQGRGLFTTAINPWPPVL